MFNCTQIAARVSIDLNDNSTAFESFKFERFWETNSSRKFENNYILICAMVSVLGVEVGHPGSRFRDWYPGGGNVYQIIH